MTLRLTRLPSAHDATIGSMSVNGTWQCFTLEDEVREQPAQPVATWKQAGRTAIPVGRYRVVVTPSLRFRCDLPLLLDVPGFEGIRIHPGNTAHDTEGCILVGYGQTPASITQSRAAFMDLMALLTAAPDDIWITVENPPAAVVRSA